MSAFATSCPNSPLLKYQHDRFLGLLPGIEQHARIFFRHLKCWHRKEDRVAETVGICWKWFVRLEERGKDAYQFATTFASLAARSVRCGRRVCGQEKAKDVLSTVAQQRHHFAVGTLPSSTATAHDHLYGLVHGQQRQDAFEERLRDNMQTPVPDQVCFRLDFPAWLSTLSERERRIVADMALGEQTSHLATKYGVSQGRISQLRRQFHESWQQFCDECIGQEYAAVTYPVLADIR